jgi:hypothetical protein
VRLTGKKEEQKSSSFSGLAATKRKRTRLPRGIPSYWWNMPRE